MDFAGKTITVTGASKGIGRATAVLLAQRGAHVLALSRSRDELETLRAETGCSAFPVDFADPDAVRAVARELPFAHHLFNCAGTITMQPFLDTTVADFDHQMNVNVVSALVMSQEFARKQIASGVFGSIVHMSSVSSTTGFAEHASYCATKGALDSLTNVMANELGPHGIRVNAVNPALTMTPMAVKAWSDPARAQKLRDRIPMGRFIEPVEIATVVAFLMSDDAAMVHGITMPIDGGFLGT